VVDLRIAVVVCNARVGKTWQNLDKIIAFSNKARNAAADIICFPEMNITGYSNHADLPCIAEPIPGPVSEALSNLAVSHDLLILAGMAEKGRDGRTYATHMIAMPDGELGTYRKSHIAPPEKEIYSPGNTIPTFTFKESTFGIQLCYDTHFPELSTKMAIKGAEILFMPHASPRGLAIHKHRSWMRHLTARAFDNSVFVVACNQTGYNGKGLTFPGNAVVLDPAGNIIGQSLSGRETMILVNLKADTFNNIRSNRMHFFLPNRRPELYDKGFEGSRIRGSEGG
jgi:N-carbamoylputrescine amidase